MAPTSSVVAGGGAAVDSNWKKFEHYHVATDPKHGDRATELHILSFKRPHMRAFHTAWIGFFAAFLSWFTFSALMPEVKHDLGLTTNQVYNANIANFAGTAATSFIIGPLVDTFGPRQMSTTLLLIGAIATFFAPLVNGAVSLAIVRFFIGIIGAVFVCVQSWSAAMFAKEIVGTTNGIIAGWGHVGAGVTHLVMIGIYTGFKRVLAAETAWRVSFVIPATFTAAIAIGQLWMADDCPKGNYKELIGRGSMTRKSSAASLAMARKNPNAWLLFVHYGCCFGIEVTVYNVAGSYFVNRFGLPLFQADMIVALFGLMSLFSRPCGGMFSDYMSRAFGGGATGMRGRLWAHSICFIAEGLLLITFSRMNTVAASVVLLAIFSILVQAAEGTVFGIVPYICPEAAGAAYGIVGGGGNVGAVAWALIFRFGPSKEQDVFLILGFIVLACSSLILLVRIKGYNSCLRPAVTESQFVDTI